MDSHFRFMIETDRETAQGAVLTPSDDIMVEGYAAPPTLPSQGSSGAHIIEPVGITIAVSTLSVLAYRIVEHWLRRNEQGVQIDARTTPAVISTISGVPNGFVIVIEADGTTKNYNAVALSASALTDLLAGLAKGGKA